MERINQHDTTEGINDDIFGMASLGMDSESCCNVADFFSILRDWKLEECEPEGDVYGQKS